LLSLGRVRGSIGNESLATLFNGLEVGVTIYTSRDILGLFLVTASVEGDFREEGWVADLVVTSALLNLSILGTTLVIQVGELEWLQKGLFTTLVIITGTQGVTSRIRHSILSFYFFTTRPHFGFGEHILVVQHVLTSTLRLVLVLGLGTAPAQQKVILDLVTVLENVVTTVVSSVEHIVRILSIIVTLLFLLLLDALSSALVLFLGTVDAPLVSRVVIDSAVHRTESEVKVGSTVDYFYLDVDDDQQLSQRSPDHPVRHQTEELDFASTDCGYTFARITADAHFSQGQGLESQY